MSKRKKDDALPFSVKNLPVQSQTATDLTVETRNVLACLCAELRGAGIGTSKFLSHLSNIGVSISRPTIDRWMRAINETGFSHAQEKITGATPLLSNEQTHLFVGWVMYKIRNNKEVHLPNAAKHISDNFQVTPSQTTVMRLLHSSGFSRKKVNADGNGYKLSTEQLHCVAGEFFDEGRKHGWFSMGASKTLVIDCTYGSSDIGGRSSYGERNGENPFTDAENPKYTDCIVWAVLSEGKQVLHPILFTFNPIFNNKRNTNTATRINPAKLRDDLFGVYDIDPKHVVFIGAQKKEKRVYAKENADIIRQFFSLQDHPINPAEYAIFRDAGACFSDKGNDVLEELGFARVVIFPPAVHQFLSPLDNMTWGVAKGWWRAAENDRSCSINAPLSLLFYVHMVENKDIKKWSKKNIWEPVKDLSGEAVKKIIRNQSENSSAYHEACLDMYKISIGVNLRQGMHFPVVELKCLLDGFYWNNKE